MPSSAFYVPVSPWSGEVDSEIESVDVEIDAGARRCQPLACGRCSRSGHKIETKAVKNKFVLFNARAPHGTCAFRGGPRFTITAYVHARARAASADLLGQLRDLGFRPPVGGSAQALPGKPLGTRTERLRSARTAWRHYCGRRSGQKCVTQPGRARGEHRAAVWKCRWCGAIGVQHAGRPRKICKREKCRLQAKRARKSKAEL